MSNQKPKAYSYIRFSTPEQKQGDSERRQLKKAEEYAKEQHGLELDTTYKDVGKSGFSGAHKEEGALGQFLDLVETDEIPEGSMLIVENLDRLGRQEPLDATENIKKILRADITLVILERFREAREITDETLRNKRGEFQYLAGEIERAYYESKYKSERLQEAWQEKRKKAQNGDRKLTGICPMWLEPERKKDKNGQLYVYKYKERTEVVDVIKKIFDLKFGGKGTYRIMKELNKKNYKFLEDSDRNAMGKWAKSTINRYLRDRRLIGEYVPHLKNRETNEKRTEIKDEVWKKYFPVVVDKDKFLAVQNILEENSKKDIGGPTGKMSNLFRHLVKCDECGGSMHFQNKGKRQYLRCYNNQKGKCEQNQTLRYDLHFEPFILHYCQGLNVSDLIPDADRRNQELKRRKEKRKKAQGELNELDRQYKKLKKDHRKETDDLLREDFKKDLRKMLREQKDLNQKINQLEDDIQDLKDAEARTGRRLKDIEDLIDQMDKMEGQAFIDLRVDLNKKLRQIIDRIDIGFGYKDIDECAVIKIHQRDNTGEYVVGENGLIYASDKKDGHTIWRVEGGKVTGWIEGHKERERNIEVDARIARMLNRAQD